MISGASLLEVFEEILGFWLDIEKKRCYINKVTRRSYEV
tara:strand:+ start:78 stop:194 length:117 start_codon:yes stop_codon:yes gene_type:complete